MTRPQITLKLATSLDGRIATGGGESKWITGEAARAQGHALRAAHDAILVGIGTALADDPELTVRFPSPPSVACGDTSPAGGGGNDLPGPAGGGGNDLPGPAGEGENPLRVVLDTRFRLPTMSKLARTLAKGPVLVIGGEGQDGAALAAAGVAIAHAPLHEGHVEIAAAMALLARRGVRSLLVEGGGEVAAAFVRAGLVDAIEWFRAPLLLGVEGRPALGALAVARLSDAPRLLRVAVHALGPDLWERYRREP